MSVTKPKIKKPSSQKKTWLRSRATHRKTLSTDGYKEAFGTSPAKKYNFRTKEIGEFGSKSPKLTLQDLVMQANIQISGLNKMGVRQVTTTKIGYKLVWSNSYRKWNAAIYGAIKPGVYKLDANEFILEAPKAAVIAAVPYLNALPLYSNSFEARYK